MMILLYAVHVLICFFLIAVVLLQQGKGADLSVFGGGATQTAFGARGAATVLHKMTVISFVLFIVTTLSIGIIQSERGKSEIFKDLEDEAATTGEPDKAATADDAAADEAEAPAEEPQGAFATDAVDEAVDEGSVEDGSVEGEDADAGSADDGGAEADGAAGSAAEATQDGAAPVEAADPGQGG